MTLHRPAGEPIVGINVTPLVDIALILLIITMVTARLASAPALPVDLPRATMAAPEESPLALVLPRGGGAYLNGERVDGEAALLARLRTLREANQRLRAIVHADGALPHRQVVRALDLVRRAGIASIAFAVVPEAEPTP